MTTIKTNFGELLSEDLHRLALWQAKEKIKRKLNEAMNGNLAGLYLNHGFNSGDRIKSYIRDGPLVTSLKDRGIEAKIVPVKGNPGISAIIFLQPEQD